MMPTSQFLLEACLAGSSEDNLYKINDATSAPYGTPPNERSVEQLLESSVVVINKQSGPSSHQIAAWLRDSFELKQTGHGGTLDPSVTGVLPISIGRASKVIKVMQESSKEYVCLMKHGKDPGQDRISRMFTKFTGPIYQIPPLQSAVKRELRIRRVYAIEMLEHNSQSTLFRVECEGGTYIRNLCNDIGSALGSGAHMNQLIRTKSGPFTLEDSVTLIDAHDNYKEWKKSGDSFRISSILRPLESMLIDLPLIIVKDSAVDALCHGADLGFPGVVSVSKKMRRGQLVSIGTNRGEAIALGRATVDAEEIAKNPKSKGKVARLERVIMERGTYPREWKSK
ncbi:MAG: RNA-guided pseudouridylation complex pseudouridine synthase subunit Cbf5 [Candidatus Thermoplasmatota archaeon]|nr:RNA-guided pseudouridylation complex pseudouridine synthase subunit Cbf5 [Candidatus Thermoplasmatota archaeon]